MVPMNVRSNVLQHKEEILESNNCCNELKSNNEPLCCKNDSKHKTTIYYS